MSSAGRSLCVGFRFVLSMIAMWTSAAPPLALAQSPRIEFLGTAVVPGTSLDRSGLAGDVETGVPVAILGGFSGIEYSGDGDRFLLLTDRGPADGANTYPCRVHEFDLPIPESATQLSTPRLVATHLLRDEAGRTLSGRATLFSTNASGESLRFDPEAVRRSAQGGWWISDEYGPSISQFDASGRRLRTLPIPAKYFVDFPSADRIEENDRNKSGRRSNGGFEALAATTSPDRLWAMVQRPLLQDSVRREDGTYVGRNCRLLEYDLESKESREFVYQLDNEGNGVNELLPYSDSQFLTIERDDVPGPLAKCKRIMLCDVEQATDVRDLSRLAGDLPATVRPVRKEVFLDLLDPCWKLAGESFPEKIEGLAWGKRLSDGRQLLVVTSDNDCDPLEPSRIWFFAVQR